MEVHQDVEELIEVCGVTADLERAKLEVSDLNEKCAGLMGELSAMTKLKDSLHNEYTKLRTEIDCQREYRSTLEAEIARLSVLNANIPSFQLLSQETFTPGSSSSESRDVGETLKMYEESVKRCAALENMKRNFEKRVMVVNQKMEEVIADKDGKINELYIKLQTLENENINHKKEVQGVSGALQRVNGLLKARNTDLQEE